MLRSNYVPGVHVRVIAADISQPDRYDEAVAEERSYCPAIGRQRPASATERSAAYLHVPDSKSSTERSGGEGG